MYSVLTIESFNYSSPNALLNSIPVARVLFKMPSNSWVARIIGVDPKYGFAREFLRPKIDYSNSNSKGTRGVTKSFFLEHGGIYHVSSQYSWKGVDKYYCKSTQHGIERLTKEEVSECLKNHSE